MLFRNYYLIIVLLLLFGCNQKKNSSNINNYIKEFYFSKPYHQDKIKDIRPIELLEKDHIKNEVDFNNNYPGGQWVQSKNGEFDLNSVVDDSLFATLYLHTKVDIDEPQKAYFLLSVTDGAKVYVNKKLISVHFGNNYNGEAKLVPFDFQEGRNNIVIKTINKDWDWKIKCKILDEKQGQTLITERNKSQEFNDFLSIKLKPANYRHMYASRVGTFPRLIVDKPGLAREYLV